MGLSIGGGILIGGGVSLVPEYTTGVVFAALRDSPGIAAYPWTSGSGFGTKYANPATPLSCLIEVGIDVTAQKDAVAVTSGGQYQPFVEAYKWNSATGFGTKFANPSVAPASQGYATNCIKFNPAGTVVVVGTNQNPYIAAYEWNSTTGFGAKYSNPGTTSPQSIDSLAWSPAGDAIVVGGQNSSNIAFISAYQWSNGFGTKFNATYNMTGSGTQPNDISQIAFNPAGNVVAVSFVASALPPPIMVFPWNSSTGFGTQYSNAANFGATNNASGVAFNTTGTAILYSASSTVLEAFAWSNATGFGTKYSNPASAPASTGRIARSPTGAAFAMAMGSNGICVYDWDNTTGFGTKYTQDTSSNIVYDVAFTT